MTEIQKAVKPDLPDELRRTLLKTSWVVPVITVVGLPAHAQTSTPETTLCPQKLTIPGWTARCDDPPSGSGELIYLIDDTATPCPTVVPYSGNNWSIGVMTVISNIGISIGVGNGNNVYKLMYQECTIPIFSVKESHSIDVTAQSTAPWTAAFTLSRSIASVTLSDIVLTPK